MWHQHYTPLGLPPCILHWALQAPRTLKGKPSPHARPVVVHFITNLGCLEALSDPSGHQESDGSRWSPLAQGLKSLTEMEPIGISVEVTK